MVFTVGIYQSLIALDGVITKSKTDRQRPRLKLEKPVKQRFC